MEIRSCAHHCQLDSFSIFKDYLKRLVVILMIGNFLGCEMKGAGLRRPPDSNSDGGSHRTTKKMRSPEEVDSRCRAGAEPDHRMPYPRMQRQGVFKVSQETARSAQNSTRSKNILQGR